MKVKEKEKPIWWEYKDLEQCPSCGVVIGGLEEHWTDDYKGYRICLWCINQWKHREGLAGHYLSYEQFTEGEIE